jgi:hypothetical protein
MDMPEMPDEIPHEIKQKIERYLAMYRSVRNWFIKPSAREWRYEPSTMKDRIKEIDLDCEFARVKTPDELATVPDINKARGLIEAGWENIRKERGWTVSFVRNRITPMNAFWKCNGRKIAKKDTYSGIEEPRQSGYRRQRRWKPKRER